jgi:Transglycosylase-like domain
VAGLRGVRPMKRIALLIICACLLGLALAPAGTQAAAGHEPRPAAAPAPQKYRVAYAQWRKRLVRHRIHVGRNLLVQPRADVLAAETSEPTKGELRRSIHRMQRRWARWLRHHPRGRVVAFELKVRREVPDWGKAQLRGIAGCESKNNPRAIGGGGAYRGLYQFSFTTWAAVGGSGDPAAASRGEQTWRAWLLLSRHGAGHWPNCG